MIPHFGSLLTHLLIAVIAYIIHKVFSIGQQPFFLCCYNAHASAKLSSNVAPIKQRGLLNNSADGTCDWEHIMELTTGDVSLLHPVPVNRCGL